MDTLAIRNRLFSELWLWFLYVVSLLALQLLILTAWAAFGPQSNRILEHVFELAYAHPVLWLGNAFFEEEQMFLGNIALGLGLILLVVIIYAFLGGTVIYLIGRLSSALSGRKQSLFFFCSALGLLLLAACGKSKQETPKTSETKADSIVFTLKDGIELEMIRVQPGTYTVGLPRVDPLWRSDIDRREVTVSAPYVLAGQIRGHAGTMGSRHERRKTSRRIRPEQPILIQRGKASGRCREPERRQPFH